MPIPTKEIVTNELNFDQPQRALAVAESPNLTMFERLAADQNVPVEKLEKLIELQERILAHNARAEYYAAFSQMQGELPTITERGEILVKGESRGKYARNEDIQEAVRPVLQKHGFALSFRSEFKDNLVKVIGILSHRSGHHEQDEFVSRADDTGSKNAIQALGSTRSYGQRYTTVALLNIVSRGQDDDGKRSERAGQQDAPKPDGFDDRWSDLEACADEGMPRLTEAFNKAPKEFRSHVLATNRDGWERLKARAAKAVRS